MTLASPAPRPSSSEDARLRALAEDVLARCRQGGASAAELGLNIDQGLAVNVRLGEVETLEHTRDRGLSLTVYIGQRKGSASSADLSEASIAATIAQALDIARYTEPDPCAGLADPERLARVFHELDLWHPEAPDAAAAIEAARRCEAAALALDPRIRNSEGAGLNWSRGHALYANSHGFFGAEVGTRYSLSCAVVGGEGEGMQRDYHYSSARAYAELDRPEDIGREAARRTLSRLGARPLSTRECGVIFDAELARGLFGSLVSAVSGGALYRKATFLLDAQGQQLFPSWLQIDERPHLKRGVGSANFDNDGVATQAAPLIADGVLTRYVLGTYSARKLGLSSTGNAGGVHNLCVSANAGTLDELFAEMSRGLYVTEVLGQGVNLVTGDYSRGAAGYWIEGGRIAHPVEEITIAGNLRSMYAGIRAIGREMDLRGNVRTGPVWIDSMTVAGGMTDDEAEDEA